MVATCRTPSYRDYRGFAILRSGSESVCPRLPSPGRGANLRGGRTIGAAIRTPPKPRRPVTGRFRLVSWWYSGR